MERSMGWAAFPGLIRYIALFQLLTLGLTWVNPAVPRLIAFDYQLLLGGEIWRAFTFMFMPIGNLSSGFGMFTAIISIFLALLLMTFGDGLEREWGVFRTSMYVYAGWLACLLTSLTGGVIYGTHIVPPAFYFDLSIMFAFAVFYPSFELLLMFIIPVKIYLLALLSAILLVINGFRVPETLPFIVGCLGNFLLFVGPSGIRAAKNKGGTMKRRQDYKRKSISDDEAFHNCESCGATDQTHPNREFRIAADDRELCGECIAKSTPE
jgi:hypothetical protein